MCCMEGARNHLLFMAVISVFIVVITYGDATWIFESMWVANTIWISTRAEAIPDAPMFKTIVDTDTESK